MEHMENPFMQDITPPTSWFFKFPHPILSYFRPTHTSHGSISDPYPPNLRCRPTGPSDGRLRMKSRMVPDGAIRWVSEWDLGVFDPTVYHAQRCDSSALLCSKVLAKHDPGGLFQFYVHFFNRPIIKYAKYLAPRVVSLDFSIWVPFLCVDQHAAAEQKLKWMKSEILDDETERAEKIPAMFQLTSQCLNILCHDDLQACRTFAGWTRPQIQGANGQHNVFSLQGIHNGICWGSSLTVMCKKIPWSVDHGCVNACLLCFITLCTYPSIHLYVVHTKTVYLWWLSIIYT